MTRKIILILITLLMMFSLASCGVRESLNEKIVDKVSETVVKKATDGAVDMNIKDGQISLKGEDGEEVTFGDTKWPADKAGALIPKFKQGQIISVINAEEGCMVILEGVEERDFKDYVEELKDQGFTNNVVEHSSELGQGYNANLDENTLIAVLYDLENKNLTISFEKQD